MKFGAHIHVLLRMNCNKEIKSNIRSKYEFVQILAALYVYSYRPRSSKTKKTKTN